MTVKITLSIPDNLGKYIKDRNISPSRFFQKKLKEEIITEGKTDQYGIK